MIDRTRLTIATALVTLVAGGVGAALAVAATGSSGKTPNLSTTAGSSASYAYYRSMMGSLAGGSMMGGSYGAMTGPAGYRWMLGGASAPGWMSGGELPGSVMGGGTDPGRAMGALFAEAPGPRVSPAEATRLGDEAPSGATVTASANRITFTGTSVRLVVLASPSMPAENFRIAGMVNPTIVVPSGAKVTVEFANADSDMAHGLVVTADGAASSPAPMMTAAPAFSGSAFWFLGETTSAGMHAGTFNFTASVPGTYQYLCPVPGHAEDGMAGSFVVAG